jgi:hypothetical protein
MSFFYRKHKSALHLEWHFHPQCPRWPETDYEQLRYFEPKHGERLCKECVRLDLKHTPPDVQN